MIGSDFHYREKIPVGILGATGSVGQKFVQLLEMHPWFEVTTLAASERSVGRHYKDVAIGYVPRTDLAEMKIQAATPNFPCSIVFSGLDSSVAGEIESDFAKNGYVVISNSRNHRMESDVPLLIPEVNDDHLALLDHQTFSKGKLLTNPNCSVIGLAMALKPLDLSFGIEAVNVVTMQAVSGAGFKGRASLDIEDNVIPFIRGEEEKIQTELLKILGHYRNGQIELRSFPISAQCNRVPVSDGHLLCVSVRLREKPNEEDMIQAWEGFHAEAQKLKLPTAPEKPIYYFREEAFPQTKLHRDLERGMAISIGRLRKCPLFDYKFVVLSHNTIRGAAGCAVENAELMTKKGLIYW